MPLSGNGKAHRSAGRPRVSKAVCVSEPGHRRVPFWAPTPATLAAVALLAVVAVLAVRYPA